MANEQGGPTEADLDRLAFDTAFEEALRDSARIWRGMAGTEGIDSRFIEETATSQEQLSLALRLRRDRLIREILP